jgi:hypothetical protein
VSDAFSKVRPGEPLKIAAQAWNQVIDQVTTRPRFDAESSAAPAINFRVRCRNATTGDVPRWGVLQITGILETPTGATGTYATGPQEPGTISFLSYPGVVGVTPTSGAGAKFVVATQPIKAGEVGMAAIDGVVQVRLDVTASGDNFAEAKPGSVQQLRTGSSGDAVVLWKEGGTGVKWGLVRIGAGAGAGGGLSVKLGRITGTWSKGATATVFEHSGAGVQLSAPTGSSGATAPVTFVAINRFATVAASGSAAKWVAAASIDSQWHLIAAECS